MFSRKCCPLLRWPAYPRSSDSSIRGASHALPSSPVPGPSMKEMWVTDLQYKKFLQLLYRCQVIPSLPPIRSSSSTQIPPDFPQSAAEMRDRRRYHIFSPLFTPSFDFYQQHLTALGDSCIDSYLSSALMKYSLRTNLVMSVNNARQWSSVFHHHLALRLLANELQFTELAIPVSQDFHVASTTADRNQEGNTENDKQKINQEKISPCVEHMRQCIAQLQPPLVGPSRRDVAGTSFSSGRVLPCGQSPLGWKLSHFIGAVHLVFGPDAVRRTLSTIYDLDRTGNVMESAAQFLLRLLKVYPALSIVESLLAAQGLSVRYVGKSRLIPGNTEREIGMNPLCSDDTYNHASSSLGILSLGGFGVISNAGRHAGNIAAAKTVNDAVTPRSYVEQLSNPEGIPAPTATEHSGDNPTVSGIVGASPGIASEVSSSSSSSVLEEPDQLHLISEWRRRSALVLRQNHSNELRGKKALAPSLNSNHLVSLANPLKGWLSREEQWAAQSGPAFSNAVDVAAHHSFADVYGVPNPVQGKVVARIKCKRQVRDPMFYDNLSDMRKGIPLDTEGMGSTEKLLHALQQPHRRLFEVTMLIMSSADAEPKEIGKVTAWRYSVGRDAASKAFLTGVIQDLRRNHPVS